jgi:hypothetical protein
MAAFCGKPIVCERLSNKIAFKRLRMVRKSGEVSTKKTKPEASQLVSVQKKV